MKRKAPNTARVAGEIRRNVTTLPARPASDFTLTPEEIRMLPDPQWVTEEDADVIVSTRREAGETPIPWRKVRKELGLDHNNHSKR